MTGLTKWWFLRGTGLNHCERLKCEWRKFLKTSYLQIIKMNIKGSSVSGRQGTDPVIDRCNSFREKHGME